MKVALVHDYIKEYGGAERVLEALHEIYPDAPVFTSVYLPEFLGPHKERFKEWDIRPSFLQKIPYKHKLISPLRLIAPFAFKRLDLSSYDVVIVSATGAYFPNKIRTKKRSSHKNQDKKGAVHICYCHTPPRYLYGYATAREWKKNKAMYLLGEVANHLLRIIDANASRNVDFYIANSQEVAARIEKFYRRDAVVIYPPIETTIPKKVTKEGVSSELPSAKYYLTGGRLARPKHVDILVRACTKYGLHLKVFGKAFAGYGEELKVFAGPTVEFVGEVSDAEKLSLMQHAKAFLFAAEDEDFGIVPVEAMAQGLPVIAYHSGGVKETVLDGKTGVFFKELTVASVKEAIDRLEKYDIKSWECIAQAKKFAKERFMEEIKEFVQEKVG